MGATMGDGWAEAAIRRWFDAALRAVEPADAVRRALSIDGDALVVRDRRIPLRGRLLVVGVGKAAVPMAVGTEAVGGDRIATGLVITKEGHATGHLPRRIRVAEAAHPIPDDRGVRATTEMLELLRDAGEGDVVLALISGGGSALLEAPRPPVTLADIARTTDLLLRAGAPIEDLNAVRIPLSLVKGGGLRRAAGRATVVTLILSDVLGNDTRVIASGPTVPGTASGASAIALLDRYGVRQAVPLVVIEALQSVGTGTAEPEYPNDVVVVIADNRTAVDAMRDAAAAQGMRPRMLWTAKGGEAATLGRAWVDECLGAGSDVDVLLGGGEATVTVRGDGLGGRNTEFALAAALALESVRPAGWTVASLATDGQDGPTEVAGAIADDGTCERARAAGLDPAGCLVRNDSLCVFEAAGGVVAPGPTGTNVNDLYVAVREPGSLAGR
jgi:glycerate 2-kinase